jgi:hypothetical protein
VISFADGFLFIIHGKPPTPQHWTAYFEIEPADFTVQHYFKKKSPSLQSD